MSLSALSKATVVNIFEFFKSKKQQQESNRERKLVKGFKRQNNNTRSHICINNTMGRKHLTVEEKVI